MTGQNPQGTLPGFKRKRLGKQGCSASRVPGLQLYCLQTLHSTAKMKINQELRPVTLQLIPCCTAAHFSRVQQLAHEIWHRHYPDIITAEQIEFMLSANYSESALMKQQAEGQQLFLISEDDQDPSGFLGVYPRAATELFISKWYIRSELHGQGIGRNSFQLLQQEFPDVCCMRLQVNRQNYKAINFYFSLGFRIERCADFDIGNGFFMNDFIMVWKSVF
jgi:ribosomal protein S18 acetylase RimI-like enzyme